MDVFVFRVYVVFCFLVLVVSTSAVDCQERQDMFLSHET